MCYSHRETEDKQFSSWLTTKVLLGAIAKRIKLRTL